MRASPSVLCCCCCHRVHKISQVIGYQNLERHTFMPTLYISDRNNFCKQPLCPKTSVNRSDESAICSPSVKMIYF